MVSSIKYPNGETRLAIILDKYECVESIKEMQRDLLNFVGVASGIKDVAINDYLCSLMSLACMLDIENSFNVNKATRNELDKEAALIIPTPEGGQALND